MKRAILWSVVVLMSGIALADEPAAPAGTPQIQNPCRQIMKACREAGFQKGQAEEGKGLMKDCFKPILNGQTVQGVGVDTSVIQACQQRVQQHKQNQGGNGGQSGNSSQGGDSSQ